MLKTREMHTSTLSSRNKNGHETYLDPISLDRPSLGDPKLHSKNSVLHCFGSILAGLSSDYDQIMKIIKSIKNVKNRPLWKGSAAVAEASKFVRHMGVGE